MENNTEKVTPPTIEARIEAITAQRDSALTTYNMACGAIEALLAIKKQFDAEKQD